MRSVTHWPTTLTGLELRDAMPSETYERPSTRRRARCSLAAASSSPCNRGEGWGGALIRQALIISRNKQTTDTPSFLKQVVVIYITFAIITSILGNRLNMCVRACVRAPTPAHTCAVRLAVRACVRLSITYPRPHVSQLCPDGCLVSASVCLSPTPAHTCLSCVLTAVLSGCPCVRACVRACVRLSITYPRPHVSQLCPDGCLVSACVRVSVCLSPTPAHTCLSCVLTAVLSGCPCVRTCVRACVRLSVYHLPPPTRVSAAS